MFLKSHCNQNQVAIVIYVDFKAINKKENIKSKNKNATLEKMTEHQSVSYRFHIQSDIPRPGLFETPRRVSEMHSYCLQIYMSLFLVVEQKVWAPL